jgi:hypothetical protein
MNQGKKQDTEAPSEQGNNVWNDVEQIDGKRKQ